MLRSFQKQGEEKNPNGRHISIDFEPQYIQNVSFWGIPLGTQHSDIVTLFYNDFNKILYSFNSVHSDDFLYKKKA